MLSFRFRRAVPFGAALLVWLIAGPAVAASISAQVSGAGGTVRDAVLYARPLDGQALARPREPAGVMDQRDLEFAPHVLPVIRGTSVRFPNSDETRHQVYSFSDARTFELRLYEGGNAEPVEFDRSGVVTLGCNIHDWMLGYILVLDTPAFARFGDDTRAMLDGLPAGRYRVHLWHPRLPGGEALTRTVELRGDATSELSFELALEAPAERPSRGFGGDGDDDDREGFDQY